MKIVPSILKLSFIVLLSCTYLGASAQKDHTSALPPDVDSLGDIWIVTLDGTYSMWHRGGKFLVMTEEGRGVAERLKKSPAISIIDWRKDRFLFFNSGLTSIDEVKNIDTKFIRHTDSNLHYFHNVDDFCNYVAIRIGHTNYNNYQSFVSQMRLLSLKKGIDYMLSNGEECNYRDIKVLTISDDAVDQHDQWSTDYRTLKNNAPNKVVYLSNLAKKYIYNPLNGWGGGELSLVWSDEKKLPFLWIYKYETAEGKRTQDSIANIFKVKAGDGRNIQLTLRTDSITPLLCYIDSVTINGKTTHVNSYFANQATFDINYKNLIWRNDVELYGKIQIEYTDSILGRHYRIVEFVQHSKVFPQHIVTTANILFIILMACIIIALIFYFFVLPQIVLFDVYDASGLRHRVRRGYSWQWNGKIIPLLTSFNDNRQTPVLLFRQDEKIKCRKMIDTGRVESVAQPQNGILIVSRRNVNLSVKTTHYCTADKDVDYHYSNHVKEDYPELIHRHYHTSIEYKLYKLKRRKSAIVQTIVRVLLWLVKTICGPVHYNYFELTEPIVSVESPLLPDIMLLIENGGRPGKIQLADQHIQNILLRYYTMSETQNKTHKKSTLLVLSHQGDTHIWDVVRTEQVRQSKMSLRNAEWVYHYEIKGASSVGKERKQLAKYIRKTLRCTPLFINAGNVVTTPVPTYFNLTKSYCLSFLGLVSTEEQPVETTIYDPFLDGRNNSRQFTIKTDKKNKRSTNHLYSCFMPMNKQFNNGQYCHQLSKELVSFIGNDQVSSITITDESMFVINGKNYEI